MPVGRTSERTKGRYRPTHSTRADGATGTTGNVEWNAGSERTLRIDQTHLVARAQDARLAPCKRRRLSPGQNVRRRAGSHPARPKMVCQPRSMTAEAKKILTSHSRLHSTLKEVFDPLRMNNSRVGFSVYRKESDVFERKCMRKYDKDLNMTLAFVSCLVFILGTDH